MNMDKVFGFFVAAVALIAVATGMTNAFQGTEALDGEVANQQVSDRQISQNFEIVHQQPTSFASPIETEIIQDNQIKLVQYSCDGSCGPNCSCGSSGSKWPSISSGSVAGFRGGSASQPCEGPRTRQRQLAATCQTGSAQAPGAVKSILGVNEYVGNSLCREANFGDSQMVPWEMFA